MDAEVACRPVACRPVWEAAAAGARSGPARDSVRALAALTAGVHTVPGAEAAAAVPRRGLPRRLARGGGGREGWAGRRRDQAAEEGSGGAEEERRARRSEEESAARTAGGHRLERRRTAVASVGPSAPGRPGVERGGDVRERSRRLRSSFPRGTFPALSLRTQFSRTGTVTQ